MSIKSSHTGPLSDDDDMDVF